MAFSSLSSTLIQVGKAIKAEIFSTLKSNQDDLNTRLSTVEALAEKVIVFDGIVLNASSATSLTGLGLYRVANSFTLLDAKVGVFDISGGFTGNLEIDILKSSSADFTSGVSVFTTKPSLDFSTASSYDESTNTVFDVNNNDVVEGDYLRLDVTQLPNEVLGRFVVYVIGES